MISHTTRELLAALDAYNTATSLGTHHTTERRFEAALFDCIREAHSRLEHVPDFGLVHGYEEFVPRERPSHEPEPDYDTFAEQAKLDRAERNESDRVRMDCERGTL